MPKTKTNTRAELVELGPRPLGIPQQVLVQHDAEAARPLAHLLQRTANLTAGSVTYSNNLEKIETIRDDGLIEGADPTVAALTGRIDVRFADTTLIDAAADGTPVDLEFAYTLPYGLSVTVKPLTTAGMAAAQAAARRSVEAIERQIRERQEAGLPLDGLPDLASDGERDGFYQTQLIRELAVRHVTSWTGVELDGGPAPPTPENIAAVMALYPVGERFFQEFTLRQVLFNAAKNGCGPSAAGTSSRAEGPSTAEPAETPTFPAPEASPGPTDGSAPTVSTP